LGGEGKQNERGKRIILTIEEDSVGNTLLTVPKGRFKAEGRVKT